MLWAVLLAAAAIDQAPAAGGAMAMPPADPASAVLIAKSSPVDGAMMRGGPAAFEVTFKAPTTLTAVSLVDDTDTEVAVTAAPIQTGADSARVALPRLDPATYRLRWHGTSAGGAVAGTLSFMVH